MGFLTAVRFLTVLPIPGAARVTERQLGRAAGWYPLVGALIGAILAACAWAALLLWSALPAAAVVVTVWVLLTRGLHLDGLADTFDGLGGGATRQRRLEIMKDSRVGSFGVLAVVLCLGLKLSLLAGLPKALDIRVLVVVPALGRWAMLGALVGFPAAAPAGLGALVKTHVRWPQLLLGSVTSLALAWLLLGPRGLAAAAAAVAAGGLFALLCSRRLGGLTGDTYGAICEIGEVAALGAASALVSGTVPGGAAALSGVVALAGRVGPGFLQGLA